MGDGDDWRRLIRNDQDCSMLDRLPTPASTLSRTTATSPSQAAGRAAPAQCPDGSRPEPRDRLRAGLEIRSLCSQHAPPADGARGVRPPRRALCQRPGSDRHRQPDGPGDVHHHRRHGRTGVIADQRARDRRHAGCRSTRQTSRTPADLPQRVISEIEALAMSTDLSIRQIQAKIAGQASRGIVGEITKRARSAAVGLVTTFYTYPEPTPS